MWTHELHSSHSSPRWFLATGRLQMPQGYLEGPGLICTSPPSKIVSTKSVAFCLLLILLLFVFDKLKPWLDLLHKSCIEFWIARLGNVAIIDEWASICNNSHPVSVLLKLLIFTSEYCWHDCPIFKISTTAVVTHNVQNIFMMITRSCFSKPKLMHPYKQWVLLCSCLHSFLLSYFAGLAAILEQTHLDLEYATS